MNPANWPKCRWALAYQDWADGGPFTASALQWIMIAHYVVGVSVFFARKEEYRLRLRQQAVNT